MPRAPLGSLLRHLHRFHELSSADTTDGDLLHRYLGGDEAAFETLVHRHAPLVWGVCRRFLDNEQDAEDSFQAVFLVLLRKADALRHPQSLAAFLHGVASRIARKAKVTAQRRRHHEARAETATPSDPFASVEQNELRELLDVELERLPEKYRLPLVLCYLEGKTYAEAARQLGWKEGTVCGRLARAREMLRQRLSRRGVTLSGAALLAALTEPASVPAATVAAVVRMAGLFALGQTAGSGAVAALAQGVLQAMTVAKLKTMAMLVAVLSVCVAGAGWTAHWVLAEKPTEPKPAAQMPTKFAAPAVRKDYYGDPLPPGALARMGSVQLRHFRAHIAFAADGKTLISVGPDRRVCTWDVAIGRLIRENRVRPPMPDGFLNFEGVALSADGKMLAIHDGKTVYLHDTATGKERSRISADFPIAKHFCLSASGKHLALFPSEGLDILDIWDVSLGKKSHSLKHESRIGNFVFSADGTLLVTSAADGFLRLWDVAGGRELRNVRGERRSLAFSADGKLLAAADDSGVVTLWETATLKRQATLKPSPGINGQFESGNPHGLAFSPDGSLLAVAGNETLVLWDVAERKERRRLPDRKASGVAFTSDGKTLASVGEVEIRLWDVATGRQLHPRPGHDGEVSSVAVSPNGKILASGHWYTPLRLWDAATGKPLDWSPSGHLCGMNGGFSPDGKWLICAGEGAVQLWDIATHKEARRFVLEDVRGGKSKHEVLETALSFDGRRLAALSSGSKGAQLSVWDVRTGQTLTRRPIQRHMFPLASAFTPGGEVVMVQVDPRTDSEIQRDSFLALEDTATGQRLLTIPRKLGYPIAFSSDGKLLAAGIHRLIGVERGYQVKGVSVTEMATGQEVLRIDGPLSPVVFSPDGRLLATIDTVGDGGLRMWDVATGKRLFRRPWPDDAARHPGWSPARALAFLPGGRAVATGMEDGTVLIWDLAAETWPKIDLPLSLDRKQLEAAWADLAADARKSHRALYTLAASPKQTLPFLAEHLHPIAVVEAKRVEKLLTDLDSDRFAVREAAAKELTDMGTQIEPMLRRVLESKPSLEVRKRIRVIQEALNGVPPAATLRTLRAIRALERIGTPEARDLLGKLAEGAAEALETRAAKAAWQRLARQKP